VIDLRDDVVDVSARASGEVQHRFVAVVRCQQGFVAACLCGWRDMSPDIAHGVDALEEHVRATRLEVASPAVAAV
jgi:hypothetical protein